MSIYRYNDDSVIHEIVMHKSAGGGVRSFLFCGPGTTPDQIQEAKNALRKHNCHCVPTEYEGRPCLELRGYRDIKAIESIFPPTILRGPRKEMPSKPVKFTWKHWLKNNLLFVYGAMNLLGDGGMVIYAWLRKDLDAKVDNFEERMAGWTYIAGSSVFTFFGNGDKSDQHVADISLKLRDVMRNQGNPLPETSSAYSFTANKGAGLLHDSLKFLEQHPAEIGNALTATAGGLFAKGALKQEKQSDKIVDGLTGLTTFTGGMTAALVKEKVPGPNDPKPTGLIGVVKNWVQEKPNRVAGYSYLISTLAHGFQGVKHLITARKDYPDKPIKAIIAFSMRTFFALTNTVDELILTFASKGHGKGVKSDKSVDETAYAIVADAIIRQPKEEQEKMIQELSQNFLALPEVLGGDVEDIKIKLREALHKLAVNPWSPRNRLAFAPEQTGKQTVPEQKQPDWREKEMRRAPAEMALGAS